MLVFSRISVAIITILACLFAYTVSDIATTYQWALRLTSTILVIPFIAVMFWKGVTKIGVMVSMIGTAILVLLYPLFNLPIDHAIFGFIISYFISRHKFTN